MNDAHGCVHGFDHQYGAFVFGGKGQTRTALFGHIAQCHKPTGGFFAFFDGFLGYHGDMAVKFGTVPAARPVFQFNNFAFMKALRIGVAH